MAAWRPGLARLLVAALVCVAASGCGQKSSVNLSPVAAFTVSPGAEPGVYILDASASRDPEGSVLTYSWDWSIGRGEGRQLEVLVPTHGNATLPVVLNVKDDKGGSASALKTEAIVIGGGINRNPSITLKDVIRAVKPGTAVTLDASPSLDPDGDPIAFEWIWGPYVDFDPALTDEGDPLSSQNTVAQTFNSGSMGPGASFNQTFDKPGTYNYVCHPHPWMRGRVEVDPSLPATAGATVQMRGYAFINETVRIGTNATVRWRNGDSDLHTASATDYTPGLTAGGSAPTLTLPSEEGRYAVRIIANDDKGGRFSASYGVRVSSQAPEATRTIVAASDPSKPETFAYASPAGQQSPQTPAFHLNYTANITGSLTWQGDPQAVKGRLDLVRVRDSTIINCGGTASATAAAYTIGCRLEPSSDNEAYRLRVHAEQGLLAWELDARVTEYLGAGFGDFNAEKCHLHPPNPPHCV